ncbi:ABC transporter ATP-binding protein [Persicimonas caeni]|uniref:ABC transporter ATP-binding protein n=1 Tax=Persicimonas caeni TaxID=2292766 RepID=A0A4Y6Q1P3_PERCE|nr:ABC transporter ATP-binding protein [Persicimonas caeni]QDG54442.1 ABC transporter ATP-binding protein [Persicimonas caeni]QED35663.1 ABC transporter ATP-binding protein [Persicimonas caeni]
MADNKIAAAADDPILQVKDLRTYFFTDDGVLPSVDGVSFTIERGKTLGLVGESGSGKSVTSLSILGLIPQPPGKIVGGEVLFEGNDLTKYSEKQLRKVRGNDISMIFQEPMTSLNPVYTIGNQIIEAIQLHQDRTYKESRELAIDMLDRVGIPAPKKRIDEYPHQMSGGMKQRAMIAMALVCEPKLLIADEPTTALDVTIQAQILDLLKELQDEMGMSILFITHDLGVVAEICDDVAVMYAGRIAEYGSAETLYEKPSHPYSIGLFSSLPQVDVAHAGRPDRLYVIPGMVPRPQDFPAGCRFRSRCEFATDQCSELPPIKSQEEGHFSACWYADEVREGTKEKTGPKPGGKKANPDDFLSSMNGSVGKVG